jgi:prophage regulatory protein
MAKALKDRLLASAAGCAGGNLEHPPADGKVEGRTVEAGGLEQRDSPRRLAAGEAASYLIGLDDTPGIALLAASIRDILIRIDSVCALTGLSVPTLYRLMGKDAFPRPVKITTTARAWKLSEITSWIETREREDAR